MITTKTLLIVRSDQSKGIVFAQTGTLKNIQKIINKFEEIPGFEIVSHEQDYIHATCDEDYVEEGDLEYRASIS